jgi:hypothetical protein
MRKLLLFGNGLGRSIDNEYFSLERALYEAWNQPGLLTDEQRTLIINCLPLNLVEDEAGRYPTSENDLDALQRVLAACDEIAKYEGDSHVSWLSEHGRQFPFAIRSFIHSVASSFHRNPYLIDAEFFNALLEWLLTSRSHVATLNYDELLYRAFIGSDAFSGYAYLLDGFVPHFDPLHLDRYAPTRQSYYLHLHGSPLYYSAADGSICKAAMGDLPQIQGHSSTHLVLTHVSHKMSVINASPLLREYWRRLEEAMGETEAIILFGYGGGDAHLNNLIAKNFHAKQIEIVERFRPEYSERNGNELRYANWARLLGVPTENLNIFRYENILQHRNWGFEACVGRASRAPSYR